MKLVTATALLALATAPALAAPNIPADPQAPGTQFHFTAQQMPKPYASKGVANQASTVDRPADAALKLPDGFRSTLFAKDMAGPRNLLVLPNGDVLAAESEAGKITLLRDTDHNGSADRTTTFADGFTKVFGLAFHDGAVYAADVKGIYKLGYSAGADKAGNRTMITKAGALDGWDDHWTRNIAFAPDGTLYLAEGSQENVGIDPLPHAAISVVQKDGSLQPFATGLRNPVGLHVYPGSDTLYTAVNERDMLGNHLVPDYFTHVEKGAFYGWPYAYIGAHPDPRVKPQKPDMVAKAKVPDLLLQSHSAPLGFAFYEGSQFPAKYKGDAFLALHGSWNAATPTGYKVVHIPMKNGRPTGSYENFATGWWQSGNNPAKVIGRPTGIAVASDGSLLIADDAGKAIWRVSYSGKK